MHTLGSPLFKKSSERRVRGLQVIILITSFYLLEKSVAICFEELQLQLKEQMIHMVFFKKGLKLITYKRI